ncbi:MAG: DUF421 domain-containing protein [Janthinobacterium lividum]
MAIWERLLIGDAPWAFLIEVLWRAVALYVLLLIFMRLMGKRVAAQLSINETAVVLMLGAAIGLPIQVLSQGILPAVVVLATTTFLQRGLSWLSNRYRAVEVLSHGDVALLLQDGRMLLDRLRQCQLSREMLSSELRAHDIEHLGQLRRVYLEASGSLSLVRYATARPGLSLSPDKKDALCDKLYLPDYQACWACGHVEAMRDAPRDPCRHCGGARWNVAVHALDAAG